jgi:hypothetical protein
MKETDVENILKVMNGMFGRECKSTLDDGRPAA